LILSRIIPIINSLTGYDTLPRNQLYVLDIKINGSQNQCNDQNSTHFNNAYQEGMREYPIYDYKVRLFRLLFNCIWGKIPPGTDSNRQGRPKHSIKSSKSPSGDGLQKNYFNRLHAAEMQFMMKN
jgi:hypothetical protein